MKINLNKKLEQRLIARSVELGKGFEATANWLIEQALDGLDRVDQDLKDMEEPDATL